MAARMLGYLTRKGQIIQNNLANQATDGFKLDKIYGTFDARFNGPVLNRTVSMQQGPYLQTGNPLDVMLQGPGFFVVRTPNGDRLTRNGSFHLDHHRLVDQGGQPVLGTDGPIVIDGTEVEISSDGTIVVDDVTVGQLQIVTEAEPTALVKEGDNLFVPDRMTPADPDTTVVRQFGVEESNVNGVAGIGELIEVQRQFAMMTSTMRSMDDTLAVVTNRVGRV